MNKKRTLAVVMAAATVGTSMASVAPVFADSVKSTDMNYNDLRKKVGGYLSDTYNSTVETGNDTFLEYKTDYSGKDSFLNSKYEVYALDSTTLMGYLKNTGDNKADLENARIKNSQDLEHAYYASRNAGKDLSVTVIDKGHDGGNYYIKQNLYSGSDLKELVRAIKGMEKTNPEYTSLDITTVDGKTENDTLSEVNPDQFSKDSIKSVAINIDNNKKLPVAGTSKVTVILSQKDKKIDINDAVTDTSNNTIGFKEMADSDKADVASPRLFVDTYKVNTGVTITRDAKDLYTKKTGYTQDSAYILNKFHEAISKGDDGVELVYNNVNYILKYSSQDSKIDEKNGELTLNFKYKTNNETSFSNGSLVIKSNDNSVLEKIQSDVNINGVVAGIVKTLGGTDRFESAIEMSKESYKNTNSANGVILVGENAIVDGLTSAPLSSQKEAPILITKKDKVPQNTINEINRVLKTEKTIYVVGGKDVISDNVITQLKKEFGKNAITRLGGADRFETSANIAKEMGSTGSKKAYVVGADGLADAMSISGIAAAENAPILVTPQKELGSDAKDAIQKYVDNGSRVDIIGGNDAVSDKVKTDIYGLKDNSATPVSMNLISDRIGGSDREGTNAAVINEFANGDGEFTSDNSKVFVAKNGFDGGDDKLIDALALAPVAAQDKKDDKAVIHPLVLVGKDLSKDQKKVLNKIYDDNTSGNKLIQGGLGIAKAPVDALVKLLGLNK